MKRGRARRYEPPVVSRGGRFRTHLSLSHGLLRWVLAGDRKFTNFLKQVRRSREELPISEAAPLGASLRMTRQRIHPGRRYAIDRWSVVGVERAEE
jgi:hypothetical protein